MTHVKEKYESDGSQPENHQKFGVNGEWKVQLGGAQDTVNESTAHVL